MPDPENARTVLITGAGGGLGRALTRAFDAAGWQVAAAGHSTPPPTPSPRVWACRMDVLDREQIAGTVAGVLRRWGRLDVLVNNAGTNCESLLATLDAADWDRVLDVNLKGAFLCSRAALEAMSAQREGHILNVASFAARHGPAGQSAYAASKAGLLGLTLALAREVGLLGIRVNAVMPGVLESAMTAHLPEKVLEGFRAANVLGRLGNLAEVASGMVALAESREVSGQVFQLDGRIARWA